MTFVKNAAMGVPADCSPSYLLLIGIFTSESEISPCEKSYF